MSIYEVIFKLLLDVILFMIIYSIIANGLTIFSASLIALIIAHSINWIINGHFFVLMRYVAPVPKTEQQFEDFIKKIRFNTQKWKSIDGVAIYGSYCRNQLHQYSDLDVRVVTHPGILNLICGAFFCFYQRMIAFINFFPLDIYCCDKMEFLDQLSDDESPIIIIDHSGRLARRYKESEQSASVE